MAQHDQHPTTEQLSAFLDGQLSAEELSQWDAHLKTCEQCQQEMTDLRLTVALLHSLPQPALPRSFALPVDAPVTPIAASAAPGAVVRRRARPGVMRRTARTLCAIAAVLGIFLLGSGLLAVHSGSSTASMAPSTYTASSASNGTIRRASGTGSAGTSRQQTAVRPGITPAATPTMRPYDVTRATPPQSTHAAPEPLSTLPQPILSAFDVSTTGGRVALGLFLLVLGILGFLLFGRRPRQSAAP